MYSCVENVAKQNVINALLLRLIYDDDDYYIIII